MNAIIPQPDWPEKIQAVLHNNWPPRLRPRTEEITKQQRIIYKANRERILEVQKQRIETLSDGYVRTRLSEGTRVPGKKWPAELVNAKRIEMKIKRKLKELESCHNQKT